MKFQTRYLFSVLLLSALHVVGSQAVGAEEKRTADIVIYGGTSAGIAAAVQAKRMGKSVIVIEPSDRIGGLTTGGLGQTDIGNKAAIGGIAREFYEAIATYYQSPDAWKWQRPTDYKSGGQSRTLEGERAMWTFEPSVALAVYQDWISKNDLRVDYGKRLDRSAVMMTRSRPGRILAIRMESGETYRAKMFIDATYEGDLLAAAGVSFSVGREANSEYGESLNGVQTRLARHHQLKPGIDPYRTSGDPASGLLPHIDPTGPGEEGGADHRVQAYCFRMCLTDHPENRIPFHKPEGYRPEWYELLLRNFEAGETAIPWANSRMPNRKTDTNNNKGFSTDFIGQNYDYPEASYERREEIVRQHLLYQQGLMWTLANHPRVPESIREEVSRWGMCRDEFVDGNGWQGQLYIREARRMVGQYVMSQKNCQGLGVPDPIGLAAYTMDSHNQQRYVNSDGHVRNEGDVQVGGFSPYGISYRSIIPKKEEVSNLLVPVCLSATHIAFGSIRMEPVFMVLGQSSATAAALAIENDVSVHQVDYDTLAERLVNDRQVLVHTGPKKAQGRDIKSLPGIFVDNEQAEQIGEWIVSYSSADRIGRDYLHDNNENKGECKAIFRLKVTEAKKCKIVLWWPPHSNRASNTLVMVTDANGETQSHRINQRDRSSRGRAELGTFVMNNAAEVVISNKDSDGYVIADSVQFVPIQQD